MSQNVLFATLCVCAILITVSIVGVAWQAGSLLAEVRKQLVERAANVLDNVESNLSEVHQLTRDVDTTVTHTNEIVDTVRRGVHALELGVEHTAQWALRVVRDKVVVFRAGAVTAWQALRHKGPSPGPERWDETREDPAGEPSTGAEVEHALPQEARGSSGPR